MGSAGGHRRALRDTHMGGGCRWAAAAADSLLDARVRMYDRVFRGESVCRHYCRDARVSRRGGTVLLLPWLCVQACTVPARLLPQPTHYKCQHTLGTPRVQSPGPPWHPRPQMKRTNHTPSCHRLPNEIPASLKEHHQPTGPSQAGTH